MHEEPVLMAAEKLTKHRLAQILITLSLLLVAFFWRTVTYEDTTTVECNLKENCSVFVNDQKITVTKDNTNGTVITLQPTLSDWELNYDGEIVTSGDTTILIPLHNNSDTAGILTINKTLKVNLKL